MNLMYETSFIKKKKQPLFKAIKWIKEKPYLRNEETINNIEEIKLFAKDFIDTIDDSQDFPKITLKDGHTIVPGDIITFDEETGKYGITTESILESDYELALGYEDYYYTESQEYAVEEMMDSIQRRREREEAAAWT